MRRWWLQTVCYLVFVIAWHEIWKIRSLEYSVFGWDSQLGRSLISIVFASGSSMETFKWSQVIQNFRICAFMPSPTYSNTCNMRVDEFKREKKREWGRERKCLESKRSKGPPSAYGIRNVFLYKFWLRFSQTFKAMCCFNLSILYHC